ncbi:hypothetical protein D5281_00900 [bacterium 1xD42-62]|uniref:Uncharacterized protein n=1 Tax=Parablautia muri TaxID=2320879 RepID=A0A9X5BCG6_9FIRM|nr:hypothetical protein [Parablautia muri]
MYCKSGLNHCLSSFDKEKTLVRRGQFFLNKTFISCISLINLACLKKFCKKVTFRLLIACHKYNSIQPKDIRKDFRARM